MADYHNDAAAVPWLGCKVAFDFAGGDPELLIHAVHKRTFETPDGWHLVGCETQEGRPMAHFLVKVPNVADGLRIQEGLDRVVEESGAEQLRDLAKRVFAKERPDFPALDLVLTALGFSQDRVEAKPESDSSFYVGYRDGALAHEDYERETQNMRSALKRVGLRVEQVKQGPAHRRRLVGLRVCRKKSEQDVLWAHVRAPS